jgi:Subtilisin inhibitor-like
VRIALVVAATALLAAGCARVDPSPATKRAAKPTTRTSLLIEVSPGAGPDRVWTLACAQPAGTLPGRARACARLARLANPFAPTPKNVACTEIYGGPQTAEVRGFFRGRPVRATFNRTNGCEISRWNRVAFLFRTP